MWTVKEQPDNPKNRYVARKYHIADNGTPEPTALHVADKDLERLRTLFRKAGMTLVPAPHFEPGIIEAWQ